MKIRNIYQITLALYNPENDFTNQSNRTQPSPTKPTPSHPKPTQNTLTITNPKPKLDIQKRGGLRRCAPTSNKRLTDAPEGRRHTGIRPRYIITSAEAYPQHTSKCVRVGTKIPATGPRITTSRRTPYKGICARYVAAFYVSP